MLGIAHIMACSWELPVQATAPPACWCRSCAASIVQLGLEILSYQCEALGSVLSPAVTFGTILCKVSDSAAGLGDVKIGCSNSLGPLESILQSAWSKHRPPACWLAVQATSRTACSWSGSQG